MPPDPAGLSIVSSPRCGTPRPRRCLPRTGRTLRLLTPLSRRACAEARHAPPGPPSPRPRQRTVDPTTRTPSIDECPARPPGLHRAVSDAGPATDPETLPPRSGFRRSFAPRSRRTWGARPCRFRTLITPGRPWPRAARRLLQSKTIRKHDSGPTKPRPRVGPLGFRRAPHLGSGPAR
jgi:hypothetical protein